MNISPLSISQFQAFSRLQFELYVYTKHLGSITDCLAIALIDIGPPNPSLHRHFAHFDSATDSTQWPASHRLPTLQHGRALAEHHKKLSKDIVLKDYFKSDPSRFQKFSHIFTGADGSETLFDFSKNFLTEETLELLVNLAKEAGLEKLRDEMFAGDKINFTENRAVYHVALRNVSKSKMEVDGKSVVEGVDEVLQHMKVFSDKSGVESGKDTPGRRLRQLSTLALVAPTCSSLLHDFYFLKYILIPF